MEAEELKKIKMQTSNILFILSLLIACSYQLRTLSTLESTLNAKTEEHLEAENEEHMEAEAEEHLEEEEHSEADEDTTEEATEEAHETGLQVPEDLKEDAAEEDVKEEAHKTGLQMPDMAHMKNLHDTKSETETK